MANSKYPKSGVAGWPAFETQGMASRASWKLLDREINFKGCCLKLREKILQPIILYGRKKIKG